MLRLGYLDQDLNQHARRCLPWLAYFLAGMTKHSQWDVRPCQKVLTDLYLGISVAEQNGIFPAQDIPIAQQLKSQLYQLKEEILLQDAETANAEYMVEQEEVERLYQEYQLLQDREEKEWLENDRDDGWVDQPPD